MKNIQLNTKAKLCILWGGIGLVSLLVGIFLAVPSTDAEALKIAIQSSSVNAMASAIISANNIVVIKILKCILCAVGLILLAFSSINYISAIKEDELFEDLMFDESAYQEAENAFSCSEDDCACCSSPCNQAPVSEEEEVMEEVNLEETEEISQESK